ncbi:MAG: DUF4369 domain-containing protein [Bacteroidia bacterium]|nr:DUF4369 domain-containing protein [Bacteroidia bacterium]NND26204.1 DUF4369 domain-containing protein [Flavobacteriaceae bacterium]NNK61157.1 DUF4369 domain-containing protein [Flavobacteriaceae bacterium]NNL32878.1 DUF4369 domain-containing protein [Flavobacteriaceae bacterium]RZW50544.1 MAG: DUF4369 domain-containing protein [Flavobacteriaceae bacterium]
MKRIFVFFLVILIASCGKEKPNLIVTGQVKGLKKGTLYLDRVQDTTVVAIDSMEINGDPIFELVTFLSEPEVLYLRLQTANSDPLRIRFFADKGTTTINTTLKRFVYDAKIEGSELQKKLEEFNSMLSQFNSKNLELIKEQFEAGEDSTKLNTVLSESDNLLKRKYLYAINYALTNKESEVAPYIALSEVYDANLKYLDTIYNVLPEHIAKSKYGKELARYIAEKKQENNP